MDEPILLEANETTDQLLVSEDRSSSSSSEATVIDKRNVIPTLSNNTSCTTRSGRVVRAPIRYGFDDYLKAWSISRELLKLKISLKRKACNKCCQLSAARIG